ncbi:MAG: BatA domain-containing protein [Planctomycetes bacterium]|nr:BatA domain-containing protein [Planctomycetota bacterium]MCB9878716.1 BatA domain-containing protein [Planctomycetota bacterium]MCB9884999.1 BatA domain-containing protein [Planctomycetota bacterium]
MSFTNPALLAGAALFAVPLIIHLLNRQRHKRRPWAAMEFLLRAYQKQRNRLRNENLLLLLLRCLLPIVLALAVARPVLQSAAGLLSGGGTVHHVIVLDGSYSMGAQQSGAPSPFERAREMVGRMLDRFEQNQNRSDKVTLVLAGVRPRFLVRGDLDLATARNQWFTLQRPDDASSELGEALLQVADALEEAKDPDVQIYVFTDLQARSLGKALHSGEPSAAAELVDTARDACERLQKLAGAQLHWIDCGPFADSRVGGVLDNAQITDLRIEQPVAIARTPVDVVATLRNRGQAKVDVEVTLEIDGGEPMRKIVSLAPGAEGEADFQVAFRELGRRRLRASLQNDALSADDERFLTVLVRDRVRVLLVDGAADEDPLRSYHYLWEAILDPDPTLLPTFAVEAVDALALLGGRAVPKDYDVTVLADVDRINQQAAAALQAALQAGRGLFVCFGDRTDPDSYNLHLYAAGDGIMPMRLGTPLGGKVGGSLVRTPTMLHPEHPAFAEFEEPVYREILQAIPVTGWFSTSAGTLREDSTVLANLTDPDQSPLLVTRDFGEGKALFLTSAIASEYRADRWNHLDDPMVAFPLLHGIVKWLALPATDPFQVAVGAELSCSVAGRPENIELQRPERDGGARVPVGGEPRPLPGDRFQLPTLRDTEHAGFYTVEMMLDRDNGKEPLVLPFAVNVDPDEGDLRYVAHDEARQALSLPRVLTNLPAAADAAEPSDSSELGPTLLLCTLLLVLGEAALARFVSMRRS